MPLVVVEIVGGEAPVAASLPQQLADALGAIFGSPPGTTWLRVHRLPRAAYAENHVAEPLGADAVFVTITKRALPSGEALADEAARVSRAVSRLCGRPVERIHVLYDPPGAGRVAFGGELVT